MYTDTQAIHNPPALPARLPLTIVLLWLVALTATTLPWAGTLSPTELLRAFRTWDPDVYVSVLAHYSWAPRVAMAILTGAAFGIAGTVTQQLLGNPLASPTTLGVTAGCQFGITLASLFFPSLLVLGPDLPATGGGLLAIALVILLTWRLGFSPVTVILAGLVISFFLGAVNMAFLLLRGEWLGNLYIWGAGSLEQSGWQSFTALWPRVLVLVLIILLLMRPLQLLQLGDTSASALGARVVWLRGLVLLLIVLLCAQLVSRVGAIGFIGLAAPVLVRLLGARTLQQRLLWSTLAGSALLLLADALANSLSTLGDGGLVPTGTATALIGGPLLLLALRQVRNTRHMPGQDTSPASFLPARKPLVPVTLLLTASLAAMAVLAMGWSPGLSGWHWTPLTHWPEAWIWRGPRILAAAVAGAALGLAGTLVQKMTRNPIGSPEMLGVSGGAALAMVLITLSGGEDMSRASQLLSATLGASVALGLLILLARRHRFAGNQLLLGGLALYVFMDAGLRMLMASTGTQASRLLTWMYGATWLVSETEALILCLVLAVAALVVLAILRPLAILSLGETSASALGLPVSPVRLALLSLAALLTAAATVIIGPISFIGLVAPHLARVLGQQTPGRQMLVAALAGALLLVVADWLARVLMFPSQLPAGLLAALVGGLYFLWGLTRHDRT